MYIIYIYIIHTHMYTYMEWHVMARLEVTARATRRATWAATSKVNSYICILYIYIIYVLIFIYTYIYIYGVACNGARGSDSECNALIGARRLVRYRYMYIYTYYIYYMYIHTCDALMGCDR